MRTCAASSSRRFSRARTTAPDHYQRFKNAIYDVGLELGGSYYRFGGVMKPYIRRMFGDEMVDRHRAMKLALDPAFILNPGVVFDAREAA